MKKIFLLLISVSFLLAGIAQPFESRNFWKFKKVSMVNNGTDKAKQIHSLENSGNFFSNNMESFNSYLTYGSMKTLPGEPCTVKIEGNSITITSATNNWRGIIDKNNKKMTLGSIEYIFGEITTQKIRRRTPAAKYSADKFIGNWQENERKSAQGNIIPIQSGDTLYLSVKNNNNSVLYPGRSFQPMEGSFFVTGGKAGNEVNISGNDYAVLSLSDNTFVLQSFDNPDLHTMTRVPSFNFLPQERKICDNCSIDILSESLLKQKWISRPQLYASSFIKSDPAIYALDITQKKSENEYAGIVTLGDFSMDNTLGRSGTRAEDCVVRLSGNSITVQSASFNYTGQIYEATDKSLIFTDKKVLIYKLSADKSQQPVNGDAFGTNTIDLSLPANIIHNWNAYKKNADPGFKSAQGLISSLNIVKNLSALSYEGVVSFTDNTSNLITMDCLITFRTPNGETGITIVTKDKTKVWDFQLYKADGKELVFGNKLTDGIQYSFNYQ
jgi:hypothetical protein